MSDAKKIVDSITNKSLEAYGVKTKPDVPDVPAFLDRRQTHIQPTTARRASASKPTTRTWSSTSREHYRQAHPSAQTPSSASKPVIDMKLSALSKMPVLEQVDAVFTTDQFYEVVHTVGRYMGDVLEGAGFVYKHGASDSAELRRLLGEFMQTKLAHIDESGRRRFVAVKEDTND